MALLAVSESTQPRPWKGQSPVSTRFVECCRVVDSFNDFGLSVLLDKMTFVGLSQFDKRYSRTGVLSRILRMWSRMALYACHSSNIFGFVDLRDLDGCG